MRRKELSHILRPAHFPKQTKGLSQLCVSRITDEAFDREAVVRVEQVSVGGVLPANYVDNYHFGHVSAQTGKVLHILTFYQYAVFSIEPV